MNKNQLKATAALVSVLFAQAAFAQSSNTNPIVQLAKIGQPVTQVHTTLSQHPDHLPQSLSAQARHSSAARKTGTGSRLIAYAVSKNDGASFIPTDSTHLSYSGTRGGDLNPGEAPLFDTDLTFGYTTTYLNNVRQMRTYDAHSNILTDINQTWKTAFNTWVNTTQDIDTYDGNNNRLSEIDQTWDSASSAWLSTYKYVYTYDGANNQLTEIEEQWNTTTSVWDNANKYISTYDANNNELSYTHQTWNSGTSAWVNDYKDLYTYDANNNETLYVSQNWNTTAWINANQDVYTYDANNNLTLRLSQNWNTVTSAWVNNDQEAYTYDANNNELTDVSQTWNTITSAWNNTEQDTYTYDANNNRLTDIKQEWKIWLSAWRNDTKGIYTYDANHNVLSYISQNWDTTTSVFNNHAREQLTYNSYNQYLTILTDTWNAGGFWEYTATDQQYNLYYEAYTTSVNNITAVNGTVELYPIPARNTINLSINWKQQQSFTVSIFDMQGRRIDYWSVPVTQQYNKGISVAGLASGTYFMSIRDAEGYTETRQFVVQ